MDNNKVAQLTISSLVRQREEYANKNVALEVKVAMLQEELDSLKKEPKKSKKDKK